jgi:hypothetical protein
MTGAQKESPALRWARAKVVQIFSADLRSLAVFRMVLALLVLADLVNRATDLYAHYTDQGILPRTVLMQEVMNPWMFSLNVINGETWFQALLFGATALAALGMLVGYRTRLMTIIVWVMYLSIQWRNPLVLNDEVFLHLLLFWGMFLPLGAYWSIDRVLKPVPPRLSVRFQSLATVGLFLQIAFLYWFAAIHKLGQEWWRDGTALYYLLSIDQITTPIGAYLYQFPGLLKILTFATLGLEAFGPFLLLSPLLTGPVRTGAVLAFMSLHFGIWLLTDMGISSWVSAFCMLCFLPGWFWEKTAKPRGAVQQRFGSLSITRRLQGAAASLLSILVAAGRSSSVGLAVGRDDRPGGHSACTVTPCTVLSAKATAGRERRRAAGPTPGAIVAARLRANRLGRGSREVATLTRKTSVKPPMLRSSRVSDALALFFILYVFFWYLASVSTLPLPGRLLPIGHFLGIEQPSEMFLTSNPTENDGWYVIPGTLRSEQQVDLMPLTRDDFNLHEVSWEKPRYVPSTFKNEHWREYLENISQVDYANQRLHFGRYLCREWNARYAGDQQLEAFQITYMLEETLPDYRTATLENVVLWEHNCFERGAT